MPRVRISTTVDAGLLSEARRVKPGVNDAALVDDALSALVERHRAAERDSTYRVYDDRPLSEPDEWGDLASFREAASRT